MENWNQRWRRQTSNRTSLKNRLVSEFSEQKMLATTLFSNFAFPRFSGMSLCFVHIYGLKSCPGFIPKLARDSKGSSNLRLFPTGLCLTLPQEHRIRAGSHWPTDDYWFLVFLLEIQSKKMRHLSSQLPWTAWQKCPCSLHTLNYPREIFYLELWCWWVRYSLSSDYIFVAHVFALVISTGTKCCKSRLPGFCFSCTSYVFLFTLGILCHHHV